MINARIFSGVSWAVAVGLSWNNAGLKFAAIKIVGHVSWAQHRRLRGHLLVSDLFCRGKHKNVRMQ